MTVLVTGASGGVGSASLQLAADNGDIEYGTWMPNDVSMYKTYTF